MSKYAPLASAATAAAVTAAAPLPVQVSAAAPPPNKKARGKNGAAHSTQGESEGKTPDSFHNSSEKKTKSSEERARKVGVLPSPTANAATAAAATAAESEAKEANKNRDPTGHKHIKVDDILNQAHKTQYLPLGDGQFTCNLYVQPDEVENASDKWCDVKTVEFLYGSNIMWAVHTYSYDTEDLLKMLYLYQMLQNDVSGVPRCTFDQWIVAAYQEMLAEDPNAEYSKRGEIARFKLAKYRGFAVGNCDSTLAVFFQKRCIRDIEMGESQAEVHEIETGNFNIVKGKSSRGKFEYQIEAFIFSRGDENGTGEMEDIPEGTLPA